MYLSDEDVTDILKLIDGSTVDELRLHTERFNLLLRRSPGGEWTQQKQESSNPKLTELIDSKTENKNSKIKEAAPEDSVAEHLVAISTPLPGTFYRAPKPGAAAFVEVGDRIKQGAVVAIIETMKLMNSITTKTDGTVVEICVENAEFADQGRVLMRIDTN